MTYIYPTPSVSLTAAVLIARTQFYLAVRDVVLEQIPSHIRADVIKLLTQSNASPSQRRQLLLEKGLARNMTDQLEILLEGGALRLTAPHFSM